MNSIKKSLKHDSSSMRATNAIKQDYYKENIQQTWKVLKNVKNEINKLEEKLITSNSQIASDRDVNFYRKFTDEDFVNYDIMQPRFSEERRLYERSNHHGLGSHHTSHRFHSNSSIAQFNWPSTNSDYRNRMEEKNYLSSDHSTNKLLGGSTSGNHQYDQQTLVNAPSFRILHNENDFVLSRQATAADAANDNLNRFKITKRHLASSSSNNLLTNNNNPLNANGDFQLKYNSNEMSRQMNRKIASNAPHSNLQSSSANMYEFSSYFRSLSVDKETGSGSGGGVDKQLNALKKSSLIGSKKGPVEQPLVPSASTSDMTHQKTLITTSSWRIGESLVQKQLKQQLLAASQPTPASHVESSMPTKTESSKASPTTSKTHHHHSHQTKKTKTTTDCHLIPPPPAPPSSAKNPPTNRSSSRKIQSAASSSRVNNTASAGKQYDPNEIQKFIEEQKKKRLKEEEKQKKSNSGDEKKKILRTLYKRQQKTAAEQSGKVSSMLLSSLSPQPTRPPGIHRSMSSNQKSAAVGQHKMISAGDLHHHQNIIPNDKQQQQSSNSNEQDISKFLLDKIANLLDDNDKLVERQRKTAKLNQHQQQHKHMEMLKSPGKRVDFGRETLVDEEKSSSNTEESSSEATTLTPNSPLIVKHSKHLAESSSSSSSTASSSTSISANRVKNDRLKKICNMAIDLQAKLQLTKVKLFGYNFNEDDENASAVLETAAAVAAAGSVDNGLLSQSDEFSEARKKSERSGDYDDDLLGELPGVLNARSHALKNQDSNHVRRIQRGHSSVDTTQHSHDKKADHGHSKSKSNMPISKMPVSSLMFKPLAEHHNLPANQHNHNSNNHQDEYNFINIFEKRNGSNSLVRQPSSNAAKPASGSRNAAKTVTVEPTATTTLIDSIESDVSIKSNIPSSSSSSSSSSTSVSSSESTSISKYANSNGELAASASKANSQENISTTSPSNRSNQQQVQISSSSNNNSVVSETSSSSSTPVSTSIEKSLPKDTPDLASLSVKVAAKTSSTKIVRNFDSNEPKRYSPASLERLLNVGINYLDTLNVSEMQLQELDKIRCIGYSQQDTVALANLMRDRNIEQQQQAKTQTQPSHVSRHEANVKKGPVSTLSSSSSSSTSSSSSSAASTYSSTHANERADKSGDEIETDSEIMDKKKTASSQSESISEDFEQDVNTTSDIKTDPKMRYNRRSNDEGDLEKSFRQLLPSESHLKKSKQDTKDGLRDHSLSNINDMSLGSLSQLENSVSNNRLSFEDDSFKKFTGEIVKKYMQEEEMRSKHQAHLLKLREKALIEKTNAQLTWLEQMKKKVQDKGEDEKMPLILRKEKSIMQKLKQEQENINKLKEVQKKATENRLKILSQHSDVIKWCQNKLKQQTQLIGSAKDDSMTRISEASVSASAAPVNTTTGANTNNNNNNNNNNTDLDTSSATITEDDQLSETISKSLSESKIMIQAKKHLTSEKYLTEREKKLRLRRKHAEEIIAWKKKLDDEEAKVREIERKANLMLNAKAEEKQKEKQKEPSEPKASDLEAKKSSSKQAPKNGSTYSDTFITEQIQPTPSLITPRIKTQSVDSKTNRLDTIRTSLDDRTINTTTRSLNDNDDSSIRTNIPTHTKGGGANDSVSQNVIETETREVSSSNRHSSNASTGHSSSSSSSTSSISEQLTSATNSTTANELEQKVKELKNELIRKKNEVQKLHQSLKVKEKTKLKEKEEILKKKINSYDVLIEKIKTALESNDMSSMHETNLDSSESNEPSVVVVGGAKTPAKQPTKTPPVQVRPVKERTLKPASVPVKADDVTVTNDEIKTESKVHDNDDDEVHTEPTNKTVADEDDDIKTEPVKTQTDEIRTETHTSTGHVRKQSTPSYEEDFTSEKHEKQSSTTSSSSSTSISSSSLSTVPKPKPTIEPKEPSVDNEKSTVSEISEEIIEDKSLKLNLDQDENTTSSDSSTDTQILLLGSSRDKTKSDLNQLQVQPQPQPQPATKQSTARERLAENLERQYLNEAIADMIEIRERKMSKLLTEQYKQEVEFNLSDGSNDTDNDEDVNHLDDEEEEEDDHAQPTPNGIFIPTIDLNEYDDDDSLLKTGKYKSATPLNDTSLNVPVFNVPYTSEKVARLSDLLVEGYYWKRMDEPRPSSAPLDDEPDLAEYFKSSLDPVPAEQPKQDEKARQDAEVNFKRMLFDLVGELMYDLYLERFETPKQVSEFFPGVCRSAKKAYFKSIYTGPASVQQCKSLVSDKVNELLRLKKADAKSEERAKMFKSKWKAQKRMDLVDGLLDREMREQEFEWANYEVEEYEAKLHLTSTIIDMLLKDTLKIFTQHKKY